MQFSQCSARAPTPAVEAAAAQQQQQQQEKVEVEDEEAEEEQQQYVEEQERCCGRGASPSRDDMQRAGRESGIPAAQGIPLARILATLAFEEESNPSGYNTCLLVPARGSAGPGPWRCLKARLGRMGWGWTTRYDYGPTGGHIIEDFMTW